VPRIKSRPEENFEQKSETGTAVGSMRRCCEGPKPGVKDARRQVVIYPRAFTKSDQARNDVGAALCLHCKAANACGDQLTKRPAVSNGRYWLAVFHFPLGILFLYYYSQWVSKWNKRCWVS
jgi:hypothetical protein